MYSNIKFFTVLILAVLFTIGAKAQKDTTVYYLNTFGRVVSTRDSANALLYVFRSVDAKEHKTFSVRGYYPNGKLWLVTSSRTNVMPLKFQGPYLAYYPSGNKLAIKNFDNGNPTDDITLFYPNGRIYYRKSYVRTNGEKMQLLMKDCNDSTGKVLALNGNGNWIKFDNDFKNIDAQGPVVDGLQDGEWRSKISDSTDQVDIYKKGQIITSALSEKNKKVVYTRVEKVPEFPGGLAEFGRFLSMNIKYPQDAVKNHIQGRVYLTFVVETDGKLSDIKVLKGIGGGCDEEAVRVLTLSPNWTPGIQNGKPVRIAFGVPISFSF